MAKAEAAKSQKSEAKPEVILTEAQKTAVKGIRRVGRMAAEFVLTDPTADDHSRLAEVATAQFGEDGSGNYRRAIFISTVAVLRNTGFTA